MKEGGIYFQLFQERDMEGNIGCKLHLGFNHIAVHGGVGLLHDCDGACRETDTATCMIRQLLSVRFIKIL